MALLKPQLRVLAEVIQKKEHGLRMLSLGYPDLLVEKGVVEELFGIEIASQLSYRDDSAEILGWHGFSDKISQVIDSDHFFFAGRSKLRVYRYREISRHRAGCRFQ